MFTKLSVWRHWLLAGLAVVIATAAVNELTAVHVEWERGAWALLAIIAAVVGAANASPATRRRHRASALGRLREGAVRRSRKELSAARQTVRDELSGLIPVRVSHHCATPTFTNVAGLIEAAALVARKERWWVEGSPGAGKSTLLHHIALEVNARRSDVVAVVIPLGTYDWTQELLLDWLAQEMSEVAPLAREEAIGLIQDGRVVLLLDSLDSVPTLGSLERDALPRAERPLFDRLQMREPVVSAEPRDRLLGQLHGLGRLIVTSRTEALSEREREVLQSFTHATIGAIGRHDAEHVLAKRLPHSTVVSDELSSTITSPLYLALACEICPAFGLPPSNTLALSATKAWLWDRVVDMKLRGPAAEHLDWSPPTMRRWLTEYAAASVAVTAISLQRWPLLYGPRMRTFFRIVRSGLSGALFAGLAALVVRPLAALALLTPFAIGFYVFGEGAATRPMAPRRFGLSRFFHEAVRQWRYALGFAVLGGVCGALGSSGWRWALRSASALPVGTATVLGVVGGFVLGDLTAALYEITYLDDGAAHRTTSKRKPLLAAFASATLVGATAGLVASLLLYLEFPRPVVFLTVPICVVAMLIDTLGVPCLAVMTWAAQRRGPIRVVAFLEILRQLSLARAFGEFYFLEHSELQGLLARKDTTIPPVSRRRSLVAIVCGAVSLWLVGYALLYLSSSLPKQYEAQHWRIAWVGFDLGVALISLLTLLLVLRGSRLAALTAAAAGTFFLVDAWFDCLTARAGDLDQSLFSLGGEIPAAGFFIWLAWRWSLQISPTSRVASVALGGSGLDAAPVDPEHDAKTSAGPRLEGQGDEDARRRR